ncbi:MAG: diguanylate cyclase [Lysobacterales bacterium]
MAAGVAVSAQAQPCLDPAVQAERIAAARSATLAQGAEAEPQWTAIVAAVRGCGDPHRLTEVLAERTNATMQRMDNPRALISETERYQVAVSAHLDDVRADAALRLGLLRADLREPERSMAHFEEAAALFEAQGKLVEAADVRSRMSRLHRLAGDYLAALRDEQVSLQLRRRIDPPPELWRSLLSIAVLYEQLEQFGEARLRYQEALEEAERHADPTQRSVVLASYAGFLSDFGQQDAPQALALADRALDLERKSNSPIQLTSALLQVGRARMNLNDLKGAEAALAEGYALAVQLNHASLRAHLVFRQAELALLQGQPDLALQRALDARAAYEQQGNRHRMVKVYALLERIYQQRGDALAAANAGRERYRLRDALLGGAATGQLTQLLGEFALSEERLRNEHLQQEKTLAELKLSNEQRKLQVFSTVAIAIAVVLALFGWRHYTVERLYRVLRERNQMVQAQAEQLRSANERLTEQSQRLYQASITDALTGAYNRGYGMHRLEELLAQPGGERVHLALLDVDHFKRINDDYGHPAGDQVLIALVRTLASRLPAGAELSRVGGEEFMILLPQTLPAQALEIAEALRRAVAAHDVLLDQQRLRMTISMGVASATRHLTARALYAAADQALYSAKHGGRNRVCLADRETPQAA